MDSVCEKVQRRLMEPGARLNPQESLHAQACALCREFQRESAWGEALLTGVAMEADRLSSIALPPALGSRVKEQAGRRLGEIRESERASTPLGTRLARALGLANISPLFRQAAWAGLVVLLVVGGGTFFWKSRAPVGQVDFAKSQVEIRRGSEARFYAGSDAQEFRRDTLLSTSPDSGSFVRLGKAGDIRLAFAASTQALITGENRIDLRHGSVWVRVKPGGRGFTISTPTGLVRVTGTVFGVEAKADLTRVDVSEGSVLVTHAGQQEKITAGQSLDSTPAGVSAPQSRQIGTALPRWVETLREEEAKAAKGAYIPSITTQTRNN